METDGITHSLMGDPDRDGGHVGDRTVDRSDRVGSCR